MKQAFGIDVSYWQGSLDFGAIARHLPAVEFIIIRSGAGAFVDPMFSVWWAEAGRLQICRASYHYLYPSFSVALQMDLFFRTAQPGQYDRLALDLEVDQGLSRWQITRFAQSCMDICKARTGRWPILYSRASWIDSFLEMGDLPAETDLWLAQYYHRRPAPEYTPEYPSPPAMPRGAKRWLIHQTSERAPGIGSESYYMDYNRWNGDGRAVRDYFGYEKEYQLFMPMVQAGKELARVKDSVKPWLNVRSEPWRDPIVGKLMPGERFELLGRAIDDYGQTWYRIGEGQWVAGWLTESVG